MAKPKSSNYHLLRWVRKIFSLYAEKMKRLTSELGQMFEKSGELETLIKKNLAGLGFEV